MKNSLTFQRRPGLPVPFSVLFKKFRSILDLNNKILEVMADMGDKLGGEYVFDRQYIHDVCEHLGDLVFKLISDYSILSQHRNVDLFIAFERIQSQIQEQLAGKHAFAGISLTILMDELNGERDEEAGNKLANLGDIRNILGLPTPDGFVITTKSFFDFMEHNDLPRRIKRALAGWDGEDLNAFGKIASEVRSWILDAEVPKSIVSHISAKLDILSVRNPGRPMLFALRSSAWGEDGELSFAGQYESVLNVPKNQVVSFYRQVIASVYSPEAWLYRLRRGYTEEEVAMAVGCQLMIDAEVSGAMYTYAPLPQYQECMVISAAWGLGPAVVEGIAESDTIFVNRSAPHEVHSMEVGHKATKMICEKGGGAIWVGVPGELMDAPCLTPEQIDLLARTALLIERYHKRPQDVEWAFDRYGSLYVLQSRPLLIRPGHLEKLPGIDSATRGAEIIFSGRGNIVQQGIGSGKVFVAREDEDLSEFPYGAILVARHTSPKYSQVMSKAQGVITDIGSVTGHMATIAREHRVPALVDTGVATRLLHTGDEITLDATQNVVYRGLLKELGNYELVEEDVFEESSEYRLLRRLFKKITPLHLVDSRAETFKASNCKSFHDITRFIHEKAVEKLIHLSETYKKYHNSRPRPLDLQLPLGLTVIDVGNGLAASSTNGPVRYEDIVSTPAEALLDGLTRPGMWGTEPVPVDVGSFMSSFTRTFSLSMADPEKIGRNLAVISKEYLNLNLRLGYHFNIVDSYIGEKLNDNYIYFRFLGGVTDMKRRSRRARFIANVLERLDFRAEIHGDMVVGRLKKISKERMRSRIRILGALIGYTRQLDVFMCNDDVVRVYFRDFMRRVQGLMEDDDG